MLFAELVSTSEEIASTRSRLSKRDALARLLATATPDETGLVVSYLSGELPQGKVGVGYATVYSLQVPPAHRSRVTLTELDEAVSHIGAISGAGSKQRRIAALTNLLETMTEPEQRFVRGLLVGELRQGALEGTMIDAIARAADVSDGLVRRAAMVSGDLAAVGRAALVGGTEALGEFRLKLFSPLLPMLAQTAEDMTAALDRTGPAGIEYKIDGARIQAHRRGDEIRIYTRNLRNITEWIPEIVGVLESLRSESFILDGEAIALDPEGRPRPFQQTMSRFGRQLEVAEGDLPLTPFFFDLLHLDGDDLIDAPGSERATALAELVPDEYRPSRIETSEPATAQLFFDAAVAAGHEGVMVKALPAPYEAGRRGASWVKVKPVHTLDLVVLGVEWGSGRRRGRLSNLHLGARDPATGGFVMLGKTFKGLTDELLEWQTHRFLELETERRGRVVHVRPEQVVEIAFDGIQASSRYPGGMALRFARVKGYRSDKSAAEADTIDSVRAIFAGAR